MTSNVEVCEAQRCSFVWWGGWREAGEAELTVPFVRHRSVFPAALVADLKHNTRVKVMVLVLLVRPLC